jgi:hypothetical protein
MPAFEKAAHVFARAGAAPLAADASPVARHLTAIRVAAPKQMAFHGGGLRAR